MLWISATSDQTRILLALNCLLRFNKVVWVGLNAATCLINWTCLRGKALLGLVGIFQSELKCGTFAATASSSRRAVRGPNGSSRMNKELKETMTGADIPGDKKGGGKAAWYLHLVTISVTMNTCSQIYQHIFNYTQVLKMKKGTLNKK